MSDTRRTEVLSKVSRIPWGAIVGQIFTAAITVAAVYLAAKVGFEQTVRYTRYQEATDALLILQVVRAELVENVENLEEFGRYLDGLEANQRILIDRVFDVRPQAFEGGVNNDMYYRLGPDVIVAVRRFYEQAQGMRTYFVTHMSGGSREEGGPKFGLPGEVAQKAWAGFKPSIQKVRAELLPLIDRRVGELEGIRKETYGKDVKPVPAAPAR